ncbi:hypothetical protein D3C76_770310 [compost metagenome]
MLPVRLVLAVQDEQYIGPFLEYVRCSEFDRRFMVSAFSRRDAFVEYMEHSGERVDVVLGEALFFEAWKEGEDRLERIIRCYLDDFDGERQGKQFMSKYQPLQLLLTSLLNIVRGSKGGEIRNNGQVKVIAVYSSVGGCGKTTVAMNLVRQLAMEGANAFYLNLETVTTDAEQGAEAARTGLARLLYDLKAAEDRNETLNIPVTAYAYRDIELQGDRFYSPDNLSELLEMERSDTAGLIEYIASSGLYDAVIADVDSYSNGRTEEVLARADRVIWLITDNTDVMKKTGNWLQYLERTRPAEYNLLIRKTWFVANRYAGDMPISTPGAGMRIDYTLPYIAAWNQGTRRDSLLQSPIYRNDVLKLCRALQSDTGNELAWQ